MDFEDPDLLAEFVAEAREHLAHMEEHLLAVEADGAADPELVNTVFRAVHSIKGSAGFLGLTTVCRLAHSLENVLGRIRIGELLPSSTVTDVLLQATDALLGLIKNVESSNESDVTAHVIALDVLGEAGSSQGTTAGPTAIPAVDNQRDCGLAKTSRSESAMADAGLASPATNTEQRSAEVASDATLRVSVSVLDRLMNLAGELVLGRNRLLQTMAHHDHNGIQAVGARLDQVTSELQDAIMQTRMQPVTNVFDRIPRLVRDLSAKLGKRCRVIVDGNDVEIDKTIIEAIGDPLTHLVRNAVDHGIELPTARALAGKSEMGSITLRAYHQTGKGANYGD